MWWRKEWPKPKAGGAAWQPAEARSSLFVPGFAEAVSRAAERITGSDGVIEPPARRNLAVPAGAVFPSEGPHGHRERMRDRLLDRGPDGLADYELLEMLLFFAQPKGDTKPVAKRLINRFGSYANTLAAPVPVLVEVPGIGRHSVAALKLVHAAAVRLARAEVIDGPVLNNWDRLTDYLNAVMAREKVEQFRILFLDTKNRLIADELQGRGTINHTPVYPREVAKRALELNATAIILVHNHPSGDPCPSRQDIEVTREVKYATATLGVMLHDHIIVGNGRCLSFRDEGLL